MGNERTEEKNHDGVVHAAAHRILSHPTETSIKRVAWAYGCAKKGSDEESQLLVILRDKLRELDAAAAAP